MFPDKHCGPERYQQYSDYIRNHMRQWDPRGSRHRIGHTGRVLWIPDVFDPKEDQDHSRPDPRNGSQSAREPRRIPSYYSCKEGQSTHRKRGFACAHNPVNANCRMANCSGQVQQQGKERKHEGEKDRRPADTSPCNKAQCSSQVSHTHKVRDEDACRHPFWN